jgi:hypothetical protein
MLSPPGSRTGQRLRSLYVNQRRRFGKRERAHAFESIRADVRARLNEMENPDRRDFHAALREARVHWLVCHDLITISESKTSVTHFSCYVVLQIAVRHRFYFERAGAILSCRLVRE